MLEKWAFPQSVEKYTYIKYAVYEMCTTGYTVAGLGDVDKYDML